MYRLLIVIFLSACSKPVVQPVIEPVEQPQKEVVQQPRRVIFFIGDGMGMNYVTAAAYAKGEPLNMMGMARFGSTTHHEYEHASTDSAASATALATGRKTHFEGVSVKPGTTKEAEELQENHLQTLMEVAKSQGLGTALVTTSTVTHATPAAFGAHRHNRDVYSDIAKDLVKTGIDVMIGGGRRDFAEREDGLNLLEQLRESGYHIADEPADLEHPEHLNQPMAALLMPGHFPPQLTQERPIALKDMTKHAIERLDRIHPKGWVMMVEGSQIDWCGHALDSPCAIAETLDMDDAVGQALTYARGRKDTLVVVTADHETGGLASADPKQVEPYIAALGGKKALEKSVALPKKEAPEAVYEVAVAPEKWGFEAPQTMTLLWGYLSQASRPYWKESKRFSAAHTITLVGVFAEGPGEHHVVEVQDNADLGAVLKKLIVHPHRIPQAPPQTRPKNVILMVADGLGFASVAGANYVHGDLNVRSMPHHGFASTHASDALVNDSAGSATALATGKRSRYNAVGMVTENGALVSSQSVLEVAEARGLKTGLVSTTQLTHATPAAFYAHVAKRNQTPEIAAQFLGLKDRIQGSDGVDVVVAGGAKDFEKHLQNLKTAGYSVHSTMPETATDRTLALIAPQGLDSATERLAGRSPHPTLAAMTTFALDSLSGHDEGFFLVVEGGQIDWKLHDAVRDSSVIDEIVDFDKAVEIARAYAAAHTETLVIVTSDHDHTISIIDNHYPYQSKQCGVDVRCGGPFKSIELPVNHAGIRNAEGFKDEVVLNAWPEAQVMIQYAWLVQAVKLKKGNGTLSAPHSAHFVPIWAEGPWAHRFGGYMDQPEIGQVLHEWLTE